MNSKSCFILGLPEAGKSTYLGALTYLLLQGDPNTKLRLAKYSGNQAYLVSLANHWSSYDRVPRTYSSTPNEFLDICVLDQETEEEFQIKVPDLSGEVFQNLYRDREITSDVADCIKESNGILFFINPSNITEPDLISKNPLKTTSSIQNQRDPVKSDATEVQLVELLQFIDYLKNEPTIPVIIAISAWDTVANDTPEMFIKERTPLLWQYLTSNSDKFYVRYYGISAQGGALNKENEVDELVAKYASTPSKRAFIVDDKGIRSHDITLPLWEAMNN